MSTSKVTSSFHKNFFNLTFHIERKMKDLVHSEDSGLSLLQVSILRTLVLEGEMSLNEVAQKTGRNKSQITRAVQELEQKRILRKIQSSEDLRSFILKLNIGVKEKVTYYLNKEYELMDEMLKGISKSEQYKLDQLISKMCDNLLNLD